MSLYISKERERDSVIIPAKQSRIKNNSVEKIRGKSINSSLFIKKFRANPFKRNKKYKR